jgi:hypothetical protein
MARMEAEVASGYPRLNQLREEFSTYFLELSRNWSSADVLAFFDTRLKQAFARPEEVMVPLSHEELALLARFEFPCAYSPAVLALQARYFAGEFKVDKRLLQQTVKKRVEDALGVKGKSWDGTTRYVTQLDEVTVYTNLDFGQKGRQLSNWQSVVAGRVDHSVDALRDQLLFSECSIANLFGLGALDWSFIAPDEVPRVAAFIAHSSLEFIAAVPGMIEAARRESLDSG